MSWPVQDERGRPGRALCERALRAVLRALRLRRAEPRLSELPAVAAARESARACGRARALLFTHPFVLAPGTGRRYTQDRGEGRRSPGSRAAACSRLAIPRQRVFLLGTDGLGRDLFSRIVYGGRISLTVGLLGVAISFAIGLAVGAVAGYVGGRFDDVVMRGTEILMSLPSFYFLLALAAVIPPSLSSAQTFVMIVVIMSFIRWAGFARIIRGMVCSIRELDYVQSARALGRGPRAHHRPPRHPGDVRLHDRRGDPQHSRVHPR